MKSLNSIITLLSWLEFYKVNQRIGDLIKTAKQIRDFEAKHGVTTYDALFTEVV